MQVSEKCVFAIEKLSEKRVKTEARIPEEWGYYESSFLSGKEGKRAAIVWTDGYFQVTGKGLDISKFVL